MLDEFIKNCNLIGSDPVLVQGAGGNISFKNSNGMMYVKSSGICLKDIKKGYGYNILDYSKFRNFFLNQDSYDDLNLVKEKDYSHLLSSFSKKNNLNPSMETGFHSIPDSIVIHTHPIYLNIILCSQNGERIINSLFKKYQYKFVPYFSPGYNLSYYLSKIEEKSNIYFLENHGLIVNCEIFNEGYLKTLEINRICKDYISNQPNFIEYEIFNEIDFSDINYNAFYPDSAVFISNKPNLKNPNIREIIKTHRYLEYIIKNNKKLNGIKYLSKKETKYIKSMETEKYRIRINNMKL